MPLRLFESRERRKTMTAACIPRIHLRRGELRADIILDRRSHPRIAHCVVQRHGSPEILLLAQYESFEAAESAAEDFMDEYARNCRSQQAPAA
ncbi:MAG: hypothetical protein ACR2IF_19330 [Terriglobales bacterium]